MPETTALSRARESEKPRPRVGKLGKLGELSQKLAEGRVGKNGAWRKQVTLNTESLLILARIVALNLTKSPLSPQAAAPLPPASSVLNAGRIFNREISWWLVQRGPLFDHNKLCKALFFRVARVGRCPVAKERMIGVFFHDGPRGSKGVRFSLVWEPNGPQNDSVPKQSRKIPVMNIMKIMRKSRSCETCSLGLSIRYGCHI